MFNLPNINKKWKVLGVLALIIILTIVIVKAVNHYRYLNFYNSGIDLAWEKWQNVEKWEKIRSKSHGTCKYQELGKAVCNHLILTYKGPFERIQPDSPDYYIYKQDFEEVLSLIKANDARVIRIIPSFTMINIELRNDDQIHELRQQINNTTNFFANFNNIMQALGGL